MPVRLLVANGSPCAAWHHRGGVAVGVRAAPVGHGEREPLSRGRESQLRPEVQDLPVAVHDDRDDFHVCRHAEQIPDR